MSGSRVDQETALIKGISCLADSRSDFAMASFLLRETDASKLVDECRAKILESPNPQRASDRSPVQPETVEIPVGW